MSRYSKTEIQEATEYLRKLMPPGSTLYTINVHTSRSGMMRHLRCYTIKDNEPIWISRHIAKVCDFGLADGWHGDAVKMAGCGMDMGFQIAHVLSYVLHGNKDKGAAAIEAGAKGYPFSPTRKAYRAGYSILHKWM